MVAPALLTPPQTTHSMPCSKEIVRLLVCAFCALIAVATASPDSGGHVPLPGPGLSYGGIPYGSMSGNVAEFFKRQAPSSGKSLSLVGASTTGNVVSYQPIEQWLR